jgi:putative oxidoreductase
MFKTIDSIAERNEGVILLIGRLAIGALFLPTGLRKLMDPAAFADNLATYGMVAPLIAWAVVAAVIEFFATLAIVIGFKTRLAALLLMLFCIAAAFLGHQYWSIADALPRRNQFIHFWKDIAIAGSLLFLFVRGAGPLSLDRR